MKHNLAVVVHLVSRSTNPFEGCTKNKHEAPSRCGCPFCLPFNQPILRDAQKKNNEAPFEGCTKKHEVHSGCGCPFGLPFKQPILKDAQTNMKHILAVVVLFVSLSTNPF